MILEEIKENAIQAKSSLYQDAANYGREVKVYLHWTAGYYYTTFDDYHLCIDGDGLIIQTLPFEEIPQATYKRNSGSISIAMCCCFDCACYGNNANDAYFVPGEYPPRNAQIEAMAQVMAVLSDALDIPIDIEHFMTHGEAAENMDGIYCHEPYGFYHGCERWDLDFLKETDRLYDGGQTLRGKAIWYQHHPNSLI